MGKNALAENERVPETVKGGAELPKEGRLSNIMPKKVEAQARAITKELEHRKLLVIREEKRQVRMQGAHEYNLPQAFAGRETVPLEDFIGVYSKYSRDVRRPISPERFVEVVFDPKYRETYAGLGWSGRLPVYGASLAKSEASVDNYLRWAKFGEQQAKFSVGIGINQQFQAGSGGLDLGAINRVDNSIGKRLVEPFLSFFWGGANAKVSQSGGTVSTGGLMGFFGEITRHGKMVMGPGLDFGVFAGRFNVFTGAPTASFYPVVPAMAAVQGIIGRIMEGEKRVDPGALRLLENLRDMTRVLGNGEKMSMRIRIGATTTRLPIETELRNFNLSRDRKNDITEIRFEISGQKYEFKKGMFLGFQNAKSVKSIKDLDERTAANLVSGFDEKRRPTITSEQITIIKSKYKTDKKTGEKTLLEVRFRSGGKEYVAKDETLKDGQAQIAVYERRGFWKRLGGVLNPLKIGMDAADAAIFRPWRNLVDTVYSFRSGYGKKLPEKARERARALDKARADYNKAKGGGSLNRARYHLESLIKNTSGNEKAACMIEMDWLEWALAHTSLPIGYMRNLGFGIKGTLAEKSISRRIDESIAISKGKKKGDTEAAAAYLMEKSRTLLDSRGIVVPSTPVPEGMMNAVVRAAASETTVVDIASVEIRDYTGTDVEKMPIYLFAKEQYANEPEKLQRIGDLLGLLKRMHAVFDGERKDMVAKQINTANNDKWLESIEGLDLEIPKGFETMTKEQLEPLCPLPNAQAQEARLKDAQEELTRLRLGLPPRESQ
jgi:hypothetical protein